MPEALLRSLGTGSTYRVAKFDGVSFRRRLLERVNTQTFDLVWVHFMNMLTFLQDQRIREALGDALIVLDQHNSEELVWSTLRDHGGRIRQLYARWNLGCVRSFRDEVLPMCDLVLSVSDEDARVTRGEIASSIPVWVVPNGIDPGRFDRPHGGREGSPRMLCVGSMDMLMNQDAVTWFTREILPMIRNRLPEAQFWIVGRGPSRDVKALGRMEGVTVTGYVDDLKTYYERADLFVAPFRLGGGTKIKVLEAMAAGVPIVSTSVGAQGLDVRDGEHLRIEDEPGAFAGASLDLLENTDRSQTLAAAARERVENHYSWARLYDDALDRLEREFPRLARDGSLRERKAAGESR